MAQAGSLVEDGEAVKMHEGPMILVIDDDPLLGGVIEACLDFEGADVRTAHSVAAAREVLDPDLDHVVLDRRLPDGDGLDLLDDLAAQCPDANVILFSAYDDPGGPDHLTRVDKADVAKLVDLLGLEPADHHAPEGSVASGHSEPAAEPQA